MKTSTTRNVQNAMAILAVCLFSGPLAAQGTLGLKFWDTEYSIGGEELADGPFFYAYYAIPDAAGNLIFQLGYGSADSYFDGGSVDRIDLAVAYATSKEYLTYGAGLRGILQDFETADALYLGPEVMGGFSYPIGETGFVPQLTGSLGIYYYDYIDDDLEDSGAMMGYSWDIGLAYLVQEFMVKLGLRSVVFMEAGDLLDDELSGGYLEVGFTW